MQKQITGVGYDSNIWLLIDDVTQVSIKRGQALADFRGDKAVIAGGTPPHKPGSTGRVRTSEGAEFYPNVYGCKWMKV